MATKSTENKRLHPVRAWLCFALAMTLLWGGMAAAILALPVAYEYRGSVERILPEAMCFSYTDTDIYWKDLLAYLEYLNRNPDKILPPPAVDSTDQNAVADTITDTVDGSSVPVYNWYLDSLARDVEYGNLAYSITHNGVTVTGGDPDKSVQYGYGSGLGLGWIDGKLYVTDYEGKLPSESAPLRIPADEVYTLREYIRDSGYDSRIAQLDPAVDILLIPNSRIIDGGGILSDGQQSIYVIGICAWGILAAIILTLLLFIGVAIDRRSKWAADDAIGRFIGRIWIELRLCVLALIVCIYAGLLIENFYAGAACLGLFGWLWFYCIAVDLHANGLRTFTCNIIASIVAFIRRRQKHLPLQRALSRRIWVWGLPALGCVLVAFFSFGILSGTHTSSLQLIWCLNGIYGCIGALIFIILYFRSRNEDYADIAAICERICNIREGQESVPLTLPETHRFSPYAAALENIYAGIEEAVNERTRAERTKIEMVTNISHDLKTPLTSIVGYADLLASVEGLPSEAADYVAVITQKSVRLNGLIKDLFALSKATTNDLPLTPEPLDLVRLCNQLLAEQADAIAAAPVTLVTDLPEHECPCFNDGTKLYRVLANLLENALRYSLDGSRVFFSLHPAQAEDGKSIWRIVLRNTSREYIDFTADEILARFVRGDRNRTTEGNGLGLPIAKSFTELCGGSFDLTLDGDTFTVTVDLPQQISTT